MAAVLVAVFVPLVSRRRNKLFFDVICEAALLDLGDAESKKEETGTRRDRSRGLDRALFVIDLHNPGWGILGWLGGADLSPSHYQREISFSFGEGSRILEAGVVEEEPQGIEAEAYRPLPQVDRLIVKPVLLNKGDSIRLRAIVENPHVERYPALVGRNSALFKRAGFFTVRVDGRILGIKAVQGRRGAQELFVFAFLLNTIAVSPIMLGAIIGLLASLLTGDPKQFSDWYLATPFPLQEPVTFVTGAQTGLFLTAQTLLLMYALAKIRSRKVAEQYSPPSSYPLPL